VVEITVNWTEREPGNGGVFVGGKEGESEGEVRGLWVPL